MDRQNIVRLTVTHMNDTTSIFEVGPGCEWNYWIQRPHGDLVFKRTPGDPNRVRVPVHNIKLYELEVVGYGTIPHEVQQDASPVVPATNDDVWSGSVSTGLAHN